MVARGAVYADFDHDGDLDVLMTTNDGPAYLFRNDGGNKNNWISIRRWDTNRPRRHRRGGNGYFVRASSGTWCAAVRAMHRRAIWR